MAYLDQFRKNISAVEKLLEAWAVHQIHVNRPWWKYTADGDPDVGRADVIHVAGAEVTKDRNVVTIDLASATSTHARLHDLDSAADHSHLADWSATLGLASLSVADATYFFTVDYGNPVVVFDDHDGLWDCFYYDRATDVFRFAIGGATAATIGAGYIDAAATGLRESAGPTDLAMGAVADGEFLKRDGTAIVGAAGGGDGHGRLHSLGSTDDHSDLTNHGVSLGLGALSVGDDDFALSLNYDNPNIFFNQTAGDTLWYDRATRKLYYQGVGDAVEVGVPTKFVTYLVFGTEDQTYTV